MHQRVVDAFQRNFEPKENRKKKGQILVYSLLNVLKRTKTKTNIIVPLISKSLPLRILRNDPN